METDETCGAGDEDGHWARAILGGRAERKWQLFV